MERAYLPDASPYATVIALARSGTPAALATVVAADGSAPQVPGASAVFTAAGLAGGTVGGGVGEARVERAARRAIAAGASRLISLGLDYDPSFESEAICGGKLRVLIDARPERHIPVFLKMMADVRRRTAGALVTWIGAASRGRGAEVRRFWRRAGARAPLSGGRSFPPSLRGAIRSIGRPASPELSEGSGGALYVEPHAPAPRLIIAGAGHVGRAAAHLGRFLNFDVTVIDDRPEFANADRFPGAARIVVADPARALKRLPLGPEAYVVIVTRGHRGDEGALRACIRRRAAYIGMIGSARKVRLLRERFLSRGWCSAADWDRVKTPIGLPIGSRTVEEIAVSIAAELVAARSGNGRASGTGSSALRSGR